LIFGFDYIKSKSKAFPRTLIGVLLASSWVMATIEVIAILSNSEANYTTSHESFLWFLVNLV